MAPICAASFGDGYKDLSVGNHVLKDYSHVACAMNADFESLDGICNIYNPCRTLAVEVGVVSQSQCLILGCGEVANQHIR